jgi:hypothetical protein
VSEEKPLKKLANTRGGRSTSPTDATPHVYNRPVLHEVAHEEVAPEVVQEVAHEQVDNAIKPNDTNEVETEDDYETDDQADDETADGDVDDNPDAPVVPPRHVAPVLSWQLNSWQQSCSTPCWARNGSSLS